MPNPFTYLFISMSLHSFSNLSSVSNENDRVHNFLREGLAASPRARELFAGKGSRRDEGSRLVRGLERDFSGEGSRRDQGLERDPAGGLPVASRSRP